MIYALKRIRRAIGYPDDFMTMLVLSIASLDLSLWLVAKGIALASSHDLANIPLLFESQDYP
jgi:hypothetical protein